MRRNPQSQKYVLCVSDDGYGVSLDVCKVYRVLPDELGESHSFIRVIDNTGEDYLFPASRFVPIKLPKAAEEAVKAVGATHIRKN